MGDSIVEQSAKNISRDEMIVEQDLNHNNMSFSSLEENDNSDESFNPINEEGFDQSFELNSHSTPIKNKKSKNGQDLKAADKSSKNENKNNKKEKLSRIRKGQYTSKFPALRAYHDTNTKKQIRMDVQIRSGNAFGYSVIKSEKYRLRQTSVFNTLAEIFIFMCRNYTSFQDFCEIWRCNSPSCFYSAISDFCKTNKAHTIYKHRRLIWKRCGDINGDFIDNTRTPGDYFSFMSREDEIHHVVFVKNKTCTICHDETSYPVCSLRLVIPQLSFKDLSRCIEQFFNESQCTSPDCQNDKVNLSFILGKFLVINLECNKV